MSSFEEKNAVHIFTILQKCEDERGICQSRTGLMKYACGRMRKWGDKQKFILPIIYCDWRK